jgi:hypothetical protein
MRLVTLAALLASVAAFSGITQQGWAQMVDFTDTARMTMGTHCEQLFYNGPSLTFTPPTPTIVFGADPKHQVTLHLDTGKVDYADPPDEAARTFWEAVRMLATNYMKDPK